MSDSEVETVKTAIQVEADDTGDKSEDLEHLDTSNIHLNKQKIKQHKSG